MNVTGVMQIVLFSLELMACMTGFLYWGKLKNSFWKWFPVYLALIVASELIGHYLNYTKDYQLKRNFINYLVIPVEFLFLYWIYYMYTPLKREKRLVISCVIIYVISFVIDQTYYADKKTFFYSISYCIGNLALLLAIISFFIQFTTGNEIITFRSSIMFWVSLGALIFYLGTLPFFGLLNMLYKQYREVYFFYADLMLVCNSAMYSLFIIGFIWGKPR